MSDIVGNSFLTPAHIGSNHDVIKFIVDQALSRISTVKLVKVVKSTSNGEVAEAGNVSVQPIVNQVDGAGNMREHGTIHNLKYVRQQSGAGAIISDPKVGDIGVIVVADRDSSAAIKAKGKANPGSGRRFNPADGVYIGGLSNSTPKNYVKFHDDHVDICFNDGLKVRITATQIILGNPTKPLFPVTTSGGNSTCVFASLVP